MNAQDYRKFINSLRRAWTKNLFSALLCIFAHLRDKLCMALPSLIIFFAASTQFCNSQQLAFPGAEGFGRFTGGGRGGSVIEVTTLSDNGPGSLRAAIKDERTRTIVFRVSGTIVLQSALEIKHGNLTIAGQTAPGDGICLRDYPMLIQADNVIIRYLRVRLGDVHKLAEDALSAFFQKDLIIDHCSFSWGTDEVLTVRDNRNSTVQWCIISESLNASYHPKGKHGYGGIWGGQGATFHHNLIAHHASRTPRINGSRYSHEPEKELVDLRNNVIYNWGFNNVYGGEGGRVNLVANYYKAGPASRHRDRIAEPLNAAGRWYVAENVVVGFPEVSWDNWDGGMQGDFWRKVRAEKPHPVVPVEEQQAENAFELVLKHAGAILPRRDAVDARIVKEVLTGTAAYADGRGIIDSQHQVGGWPVLHSTVALEDSDHDGIADAWELQHGLNPNDASDRNRDFNSDGYTNLEKYLNSLAKKAHIAGSKSMQDGLQK